ARDGPPQGNALPLHSDRARMRRGRQVRVPGTTAPLWLNSRAAAGPARIDGRENRPHRDGAVSPNPPASGEGPFHTTRSPLSPAVGAQQRSRDYSGPAPTLDRAPGQREKPAQ